MPIEIRKENDDDQAAIRCVTKTAFRDMPYSGGDEQDVIDRLRSVGALSLSLVATLDRDVIGHIAFSPARAADGSGPWFALGPVSVLPERQRRGIGSALIECGLADIEQRGALGCVLMGNPEYYRRFGFEPAVANAPENEPGEFFMLKLFAAKRPRGAFRFHEAFYSDS